MSLYNFSQFFKDSNHPRFREYLAIFKKTVAMHEIFLCRLAAHPVFKNDPNFRIFLEYEQDVFLQLFGLFVCMKNFVYLKNLWPFKCIIYITAIIFEKFNGIFIFI